MAASISISLAAHSYLSGSHTRASRLASPCPPPSSTFSARRPSGAPLCAAARHQQWPPPKKRSSAQRPPRPPPRRRAPERDFRGSGRGRGRVAEMVRAPVVVEEEEQQYEEFEEYEEEVVAGRSRSPAALPKPPAGFVLDAQGRCIAAGSKRTITIVDETNDRPLECLIRRVFRSSREHECMLLCPVDAPVQVLKSTNFAGWTAVDGDDLKEIVPAVAYALAKVYMHFVESGFCYTARGGFCFPEDAIQEFHVIAEQLSPMLVKSRSKKEKSTLGSQEDVLRSRRSLGSTQHYIAAVAATENGQRSIGRSDYLRYWAMLVKRRKSWPK